MPYVDNGKGHHTGVAQQKQDCPPPIASKQGNSADNAQDNAHYAELLSQNGSPQRQPFTELLPGLDPHIYGIIPSRDQIDEPGPALAVVRCDRPAQDGFRHTVLVKLCHCRITMGQVVVSAQRDICIEQQGHKQEQ